MSKILSKDAILGAIDIPMELVSVPEWGGDVWVKGMTGAERDKFEGGVIEQRGTGQSLNLANIRAKLCSMTICDEDRKRLFSEADIQALSQKSALALNRIFIVAQRLSGLGDAEIEELTGEVKTPFEGSASV